MYYAGELFSWAPRKPSTQRSFRSVHRISNCLMSLKFDRSRWLEGVFVFGEPNNKPRRRRLMHNGSERRHHRDCYTL